MIDEALFYTLVAGVMVDGKKNRHKGSHSDV